MEPIVQAEIRPLYGQVEIGDPIVSGYPQFETGEELVVVLPQRIAVATRSDTDGPVIVEVWKRGVPSAMLRDAVLVHAGRLVLAGDNAEVGNTVGNQFRCFDVGKGEHNVLVYTKPAGGFAERILFLIDPIDS